MGVVGRTGSGKSTLILSLMRSIARSEGQILVGGVDIETIPLSQMRAGISVVLQEHFLFAGTVREVSFILFRTLTPRVLTQTLK